MSASPKAVATQNQPRAIRIVMDLFGHLVEAWDAVSFFLALYLVDIITFGKPVGSSPPTSPPLPISSGKHQDFQDAAESHSQTQNSWGFHMRSRSYDEPVKSGTPLSPSSSTVRKHGMPRTLSPLPMRSFSPTSPTGDEDGEEEDEDEKKHTHLPSSTRRLFNRSANQTAQEQNLHAQASHASSSPTSSQHHHHQQLHSNVQRQPKRSSSIRSDTTHSQSSSSQSQSQPRTTFTRRRSSGGSSSGYAAATSYPSTNLDVASRRRVSSSSSSSFSPSQIPPYTSHDTRAGPRQGGSLHHNQKEVLRLQVERALRWQPFVKFALVALPVTVLLLVGLYLWMPKGTFKLNVFSNKTEVPDWQAWVNCAKASLPARGQGFQLLRRMLLSTAHFFERMARRV